MQKPEALSADAQGEVKAHGDGGTGDDAPTAKTSDVTENLSPDLKSVVEAWPGLPDAVKVGIVAMVKAAKGGRDSRALDSPSVDGKRPQGDRLTCRT
ncbi:MAG: hypothetical protein AB1696_19220 [Planctomycetota bacterium]